MSRKATSRTRTFRVSEQGRHTAAVLADTMNKAWIQVLLVAVPVLSLVGAWLALRGRGSGTDRTPERRHQTDER